VQVLDGRNSPGAYSSHGDVFAIQGATMVPDRPHPGGWMRSLPSEDRARPAGEWNHYRVECKDGRVSLAVNGNPSILFNCTTGFKYCDFRIWANWP